MHKRHKAQTTTTIGFRGTVAGVIKEERRAHGGVCHVDRCSCGATRETNSNGLWEERGRWVEAPATLERVPS